MVPPIGPNTVPCGSTMEFTAADESLLELSKFDILTPSIDSNKINIFHKFFRNLSMN